MADLTEAQAALLDRVLRARGSVMLATEDLEPAHALVGLGLVALVAGPGGVSAQHTAAGEIAWHEAELARLKAEPR